MQKQLGEFLQHVRSSPKVGHSDGSGNTPMPQPKRNRIGDKGKRGRTLVLIDARRLLARAVFRAAVRRGGNND
jgi:hypothetical protein